MTVGTIKPKILTLNTETLHDNPTKIETKGALKLNLLISIK